MRKPFTLFDDNLPTMDVATLTSRLHEMALNKELIGISFMAMTKQRGYMVNAAGEAYRNPTFTIGMCVVLIVKLLKRINIGSL